MGNANKIKSNKIFELYKQFINLRKILKAKPQISELIFQGLPLSKMASISGLFILLLAFFKKDLNQVAVNHGIVRLKINNYNEEIIWDYPSKRSAIIYADPIVDFLESNFKEIQFEVLNSLEQRTKFPDSDNLTNTKGLWQYLNFYDRLGLRNEQLHEALPKTSLIVEKLPLNLSFGFAFISVLSPNTTIKPHKGSSSLRQRYHLGIEIPENSRSRIRVDKTWISWQEGKAFGFNDALEHEVEHFSNKRRIVLIVDLWPSDIPKEVIDAIESNPELLNFAVIK
jgi:hypothetical protein